VGNFCDAPDDHQFSPNHGGLFTYASQPEMVFSHEALRRDAAEDALPIVCIR
jgi:hypothetical protein